MNGQLAAALRKAPYQVNLLLAGVDNNEPSLYFCDYLAALQKMDYGAHGYPAYFILSTMDSHWKVCNDCLSDTVTTHAQPKMNEDEAKELVKMCIQELQKRFVLNQPNFLIKKVSASGIEVINIE